MITFHDGTHKLLLDYCSGKAWDNAQLLNNPTGKWANLNTVPAITLVLQSTKLKIDGIDIAALTKAEEANLWVIKGFHQEGAGGGLISSYHLTVNYAGRMYHVEFIMGNGQQVPVAMDVPTTGIRYKEDLDGFKLR